MTDNDEQLQAARRRHGGSLWRALSWWTLAGALAPRDCPRPSDWKAVARFIGWWCVLWFLAMLAVVRCPMQ